MSLLAGRRSQAISKIDSYISTLNKDLAIAQGEASLRSACLKLLESLRAQIEKEESLAHITQSESEAAKEFDSAIARLESAIITGTQGGRAKIPADHSIITENPIKPVLKSRRVIKPIDFVTQNYLRRRTM